MLKRCPSNQSHNEFMCINNPVSFEFYVTNNKNTRGKCLYARSYNLNRESQCLLRMIFRLSRIFYFKNLIFLFRDFTKAKCYRLGFTERGQIFKRFQPIISQEEVTKKPMKHPPDRTSKKTGILQNIHLISIDLWCFHVTYRIICQEFHFIYINSRRRQLLQMELLTEQEGF